MHNQVIRNHERAPGGIEIHLKPNLPGALVLTGDLIMDGELVSEWRHVRFALFQALDSLSVHEIYLIERSNNVLTVCYVLDDAEKLRPLTRMRLIDSLIEKHAPDLYRSYVFLHEVWTRTDWGRQLVSKVMARKTQTLLP